jgi:hypothetical protein
MNELDRLNQIVTSTNTVDFRIHSYDSDNLTIIGSFDFSYYHEVEIVFSEVEYISLPADFNEPLFRLGDENEVEAIAKLVALEEDDTVFCIEAETTCSIEKLSFYIVSRGISLREGMVYYYDRENLKEGERIATWVKKHN